MSKKNKIFNKDLSESEQQSGSGNDTELLSDDELKIISAAHKDFDRSTLPNYDNSDVAKAKRYAKKNKPTVIFVAATVLLLIAVIVTLSIFLYLQGRNAPSTEDFKLTLGDDDYTLKYKSAMRDDVLYLDIIQIARYAELVISGSDSTVKITCDDGTYVRFEQGEDTALVNGERAKLGGVAEIVRLDADSEGKMQCFVPYTFIEKLFSLEVINGTRSVYVSYSNKTNEILIHRITYKESGEALPISFSADCFDLVADSLLKNDADGTTYTGTKDNSLSMTLLVNKNNPLGEFFTPEGLISLNDIGCPVAMGREFLLEERAARALTQMLSALGEALGKNAPAIVTSAYRSYSYQKALYDKYVQNRIARGMSPKDAEADASRTSAKAGESEHQSGLCVDLLERGERYLSVSFEESDCFAWLSENAHKYGYILRYPKGKEDITKYDYEPWHYRFVGVDAARVIYEDKICLEEYLAAY